MDEKKVQEIINNELEKRLTKSQYEVAKVPIHQHQGTDSPNINFGDLIRPTIYSCVATTTNGTTPVNVFGSSGYSYPLTITGVFVASLDSATANITLLNNGTSVTVIAKSTTPTALTSATSLTHTSYTKGNSMTVKSDSSGNSTLFMTFSI